MTLNAYLAFLSDNAILIGAILTLLIVLCAYTVINNVKNQFLGAMRRDPMGDEIIRLGTELELRGAALQRIVDECQIQSIDLGVPYRANDYIIREDAALQAIVRRMNDLERMRKNANRR